jgi:hypothetical protein
MRVRPGAMGGGGQLRLAPSPRLMENSTDDKQTPSPVFNEASELA